MGFGGQNLNIICSMCVSSACLCWSTAEFSGFYISMQQNRICFTALKLVYTVNPPNLFGTAREAVRLRELLQICVKVSDAETLI